MQPSQVFEFFHSYQSQLIRGSDVNERPPLVMDRALQYGGNDRTLLDIGCGAAQKTIELTNAYKQIVGLEPSSDLLDTAEKTVQEKKINNIRFIKGIAGSLPFKAHHFDVVTSILSWWEAKEVARVLKPQGLFLIECIGPEDKKTFTEFFGKDKQGWRGANLNTDLPQMKHQLQQKLSPYFDAIDIHNISWQTSYTPEGLWLLLKNTYSSVRNFNEIEDRTNFDNAIDALQENNQIILSQNRLVVIARKS